MVAVHSPYYCVFPIIGRDFFTLKTKGLGHERDFTHKRGCNHQVVCLGPTCILFIVFLSSNYAYTWDRLITGNIQYVCGLEKWSCRLVAPTVGPGPRNHGFDLPLEMPRVQLPIMFETISQRTTATVVNICVVAKDGGNQAGVKTWAWQALIAYSGGELYVLAKESFISCCCNIYGCRNVVAD